MVMVEWILFILWMIGSVLVELVLKMGMWNI